MKDAKRSAGVALGGEFVEFIVYSGREGIHFKAGSGVGP